jgi:hypothetical protein
VAAAFLQVLRAPLAAAPPPLPALLLPALLLAMTATEVMLVLVVSKVEVGLQLLWCFSCCCPGPNLGSSTETLRTTAATPALYELS